ncbi:MAG: MFS transporter [Planctomycetota bacterium]
MMSLILAGEVIFVPAFHPGRYFRTSLLEAFGIDNFQLGEAAAWYGVAAMISYGLGGPLADRFGTRPLMFGSLIATAAGSLYMATLPSLLGLKLLFAFWGVSTIFAFWSPLVRATRELGGGLSQGRAFGILDGGRGFVAWAIAAVSAEAIGRYLTPEAGSAGDAMRSVLVGYAVVTAAVAVIVWFGLPPELDDLEDTGPQADASQVFALLKNPRVWLLATIVLTAYCTYKTQDYYGQFTEDIYGLDKQQSARLTSSLTFLRIFAALGAGYLADWRFGASRTVIACFGVLTLAFAGLYVAPVSSGYLPMAIANVAVAWATGCGLRIYFSLLAESGIPRSLTGTTTGMISLVGFTPDIFWPLLGGWYIASARDAGDVLPGYQRLWLTLAVISAVGFAAAALLRRQRPKS